MRKENIITLKEVDKGMVMVIINCKHLRLSYNTRRKYELSSSVPFAFTNMKDAINNLTEYLKEKEDA